MGDADLDRYTFDEDGRIYTDGDVWLPSVSTVLNSQGDPPGLRKYKQRTPQAKQDWTTFYTSNRGTLIHYELLSHLDPDLPWTDDEQSSKEMLQGRLVDKRTGLTGDRETWEQYDEDQQWCLTTWAEYIEPIYGIEPSLVLDVEMFVTNTAVGYAGQFDLLYTDDGDVVLADIKTSKRVYDKHLLQLVAYDHAVDIGVDRLEVIRLNPDGETWEVSRSDEWMESRDELWDEFVAIRDDFEQQQIDRLKERAKEIRDAE